MNAFVRRLFLAVPFVLAACGTTATPGTSPAASTSAAPSPRATATPSPTPSATARPSPSPTSTGGATATPPATPCVTTASGTGTVAQAQLVDVRVASHGDYDRVVFEFAGRGGPAGVPAYEIALASRPITRDPSDLPLAVAGDPVLRILLRGGTKQSLDGTSTYTGPTDFKTAYPTLRELVEGGDFEAVATWYAGLSGASCVRASTLAAPARLVIDLSRR